MAGTTMRVDDTIFALARDTLVRKCEPRLRPKIEAGGVGGFEDPAFIKAHGPGLHKLSDMEILGAALELLMKHVAKQPEGRTGIPLIDDVDV